MNTNGCEVSNGKEPRVQIRQNLGRRREPIRPQTPDPRLPTPEPRPQTSDPKPGHTELVSPSTVSVLQQREVRERTPGPSCPQIPQGVSVRGHAGLVINKLSPERDRTWGTLTIY